MNSENTETPRMSGVIQFFFCLNFIAAVFLCSADTLLGTRIDSWMGFDAVTWGSILPGFAVYFAGIAMGSGVLSLLLSLVAPKGWSRRLIVIVSTVAIMGALTFLGGKLAFIRLAPFIATYGYFATGTLALVGLLGLRKNSMPWISLITLIAVAAGMALVHVHAITLFTFDHSPTLSHTYGVVWFGGVTVIGGLFLTIGLDTMPRRRMGSLGIALVACIAPIAAYLTAPTGEISDSPDAKNVFLITADTLRADYTSSYGGQVPTPNIDRLAESGTRLDQYYTVAPWTVPSFAGLFSSKYPPSITLHKTYDERMEELSYYRDMQDYWEGAEGRSLVQDISESGYTSYAFIGNFALYGHGWLLGDFDRQIILPLLANSWHGPFNKLPLLSAALRKAKPEAYSMRPFDYTRAITNYAEAFLRFRTEGNFFLWAHYFDPHTPYDPPKRYRSVEDEPFDFFPIRATEEMIREHDYVQSLYEGEVRYVDESIGRLLDTVEDRDLNDSTYIFFSSDHGEEFWDHGGFGHGHTVFNEQLRVPFIVSGPDIANTTIDYPISGIDIIPTMAELLGQPPYDEWRGTSIAPFLKGEKMSRQDRPVFAQATGLLPPSPEPLQTVVQWPFKLIRGMESNTYRLFNIENDPGETKDVIQQSPRQAETLATLLAEWATTFPVTFAELKNEGTDLTVDQETLENLGAIGYLE